MTSTLRVAFAGTPEFAQIALAAIHQAGFPVIAVLSQPDRPAGRGMQLQASPVKQYAVTHGFAPILQPPSLRRAGKYPREAAEVIDALTAQRPDVMVVAAYGLILPQAVRISLPPTVGFLVQIVKNTSIASIIGLVELAQAGKLVSNATFQPFLVFPIVAGIYFVFCYPLSRFAFALERKYHAHR